MHTLQIFLNSILPNIHEITQIVAIFAATGLVGMIFFIKWLDIEEWSIIIPGGIITGVLSFILFLGAFSYIFKGPNGILIILLIFLIAGWTSGRKLKLPKLKLPKIDLHLFLQGAIYVFFITLGLFTAGNNTYGGDTIAYWAFATSFGNGNYPLHSPWQPDLLAAHHQGTFLYEGAINALTSANIQLIHSLFSMLIILASIFLLWGWIKKLTAKRYLSIIPVMAFYISFAALFVVLPLSLKTSLNAEVTHPGKTLPIMTDFKNRLGGSSNLNELFYINHRATAFAGMILIFLIASVALKVDDKYKIFLLTALIIPSISSDEVVLPAIGSGLLFWWILELKKVKQKTRYLFGQTLPAIILALGLFLLVGSALRDSLFIPSPKPRFQLVTDWNIIKGRFLELRGASLIYPDYNFLLYIIDFRLLALGAIILGFLLKNKWINILLFSLVGTLAAMLFSEHTYYPGNHGRFLHLFYLITALTFCTGLILVLKKRLSILTRGLVYFLLLYLVIPGIVISQIYLLFRAKDKEYPNFNSKVESFPVLNWIKNGHAQKRVFFLDGYLKGIPYSYLTLASIQRYGLLVPVSPASLKVHTPDYGIEAMDTIFFLDPESIRNLKIDYIYILNTQLSSLPTLRQQDLKNGLYFQPLFNDKVGVLYQVTNLFKLQPSSNEIKIADLSKIINKGSRIYLQHPPKIAMPLRSVLLLALQDIGTVYTEHSSGFFNYIETDLHFVDSPPVKKYDYLVLDVKTDPKTVCDCQSFEPIWKVPEVIIYKVNNII